VLVDRHKLEWWGAGCGELCPDTTRGKARGLATGSEQFYFCKSGGARPGHDGGWRGAPPVIELAGQLDAFIEFRRQDVAFWRITYERVDDAGVAGNRTCPLKTFDRVLEMIENSQ
jgi:hypothetical protein